MHRAAGDWDKFTEITGIMRRFGRWKSLREFPEGPPRMGRAEPGKSFGRAGRRVRTGAGGLGPKPRDRLVTHEQSSRTDRAGAAAELPGRGAGPDRRGTPRQPPF